MKKQTLASEMLAEAELKNIFLKRKMEMIQAIMDIKHPETVDKLRHYVTAAVNYDKEKQEKGKGQTS